MRSEKKIFAPLDLGIGREEFQVMTEIRKRHPTLTIVMLIDFVETDLIEKAKQLKVEDKETSP